MKAWLATLALGAMAVPAAAWAQSAKSDNKVGAEETAPLPRGAEQDYEPKPALWLLSDEDTKIYLFGTFHVLPPGFRWRNAQFDAVVAAAEELVVETSDGDAEGPMRELLAPLLTDEDRPRVSDRLSPTSAKKWLLLAGQSGVPAEAFDRMPPILSLFFLGAVGVGQGGSDHDYGVESVLETEFAEAGKPVGSIENAGAVMQSLLAIDENLLIRVLEKSLAQWDGDIPEVVLAAMNKSMEGEDAPPGIRGPFAEEHMWARGEMDLEAMFDDSVLGRLMHKAILANRNRAWAGWLDKRLETPGTVLLAVGAGHFEGQDSVLTLLAKRGLVPVRLN